MAAGDPILPGATLGVLGGGQLGRMFIHAAHRMGYRVHLYAPEDDAPGAQAANRVYTGAYDDLDAVESFARSVAVVTFEFENVPAPTAATAARHTPVRPAGNVLHVAQNRIREKSTLAGAGLPVTPFAAIRSRSDLDAAAEELGTPAILKTASWGYDGKGQKRIEAPGELDNAWEALVGGNSQTELVLEQCIAFKREISVVAARGLDGEIACYAPFENDHHRHILDVTRCPARISRRLADGAIEIARGVMTALDVAGVLCVEFFVAPGDQLLINEIAPRPHNSGHLTLDACVTSQFEQQVRAICGIPLGSTRLHRPAAMANLLGDHWQDGPPPWDRMLRSSEVKLHLYGKHEARPGRKMGHLTVTATNVDDAARSVLDARASLTTTGADAPRLT